MTTRDAARHRRQLAALRAYVDAGSIKAAAHRLGITDSTCRRRLYAYCAANKTTLPQAVFDLGRETERAHFVRS